MTLELKNVVISGPQGALFAPLTLTIADGAVAAVMAPSGAGKSSLLAYIAGVLEAPLQGEGQVILNGRDMQAVPVQARRIAMLFQDDLLFPHLTVAENLGFGLPAGLGRAARRLRIAAALEEAELAGLGGRLPEALSGGQRARIAVMRALLAEPAAVLLDEPFAKLDVALKKRFRTFMWHHLQRLGLPSLLVTHDPGDAESVTGPRINLGPPTAGR